MDMQGNVQAEHGRFEQIVSQFLLKSLHIILDSRVPSIRSSSRASDLLSSTPVKKSDKWFSLVLGDRPASLDNLNYWHRNLMEPMIIDIILAQDVLDSSSEDNINTALGLGNHVETVIERWVVQYEYVRTAIPQAGESAASYKKTYKKSIILLRSLYAIMRLLPAYKAFKICSSTETSDFDINYKVSSFSAPLARADEEAMKQYSFQQIDAPQGRLSISVTYRKDLSNFNLETSPCFPPQIIPDYVGSPATDPFRAFPKKGENSTSFPLRGIQAPPSYPFQRPHSWTSGIHRASPSMHPVGGSPPIHRTFNMPTDSPSPPTDVFGQRIPNYRLASHHRISSDEHHLSPPFSPSPSPSPPTYLSGGNPVQHRLGAETAPVSIPHPIVGRSPRYLSPNLSDPNRQLLPPLSPRSTRHDHSSHESSPGRLSRKLDPSRAAEYNNGIVNPYPSQKVTRDSRDDSGRFSGVLSSSGSPRVGFSRSSSRLSFQDDLDVVDFSCPFIVDDVDTSDSTGSHTLDGRKGQEFSSQAFSSGRKSQDAAVGALVQMLRTAPPLRQDSSCFSSASSKTDHHQSSTTTTSGFYIARKTSDALEELKTFRKMKDLLLSRSGTPVGNNKET